MKLLLRPDPVLMVVSAGSLLLCSRRRIALAAAFFLSLFLPALSQPSSASATNSLSLRSFVFRSFDSDSVSELQFFTNATYNMGALQLTPDSRNSDPDYNLTNKAGRVFLNHAFNIWKDHGAAANATRHVASFNTSFIFNVHRFEGITPGEGLAFLIAPSLDGPPPGSEGPFLGLTNVTLNGHPDNRFVAVELDTVTSSNASDPNDNHVGLDINSVVSNTTTDMTSLGIQIASVNETSYMVWIDYDGGARYIRVYMNDIYESKPAVPALHAPLDLSEYLNQQSYFGFAASTGETYELNCVRAWNLTVEILPDGDDDGLSRWKMGALIAGAAAVAALVVGVSAGVYMKRRRGVDQSAVVAWTLKSLPGTPRKFEFRELRRATRNFDEKMKLGQGGFGVVYRGIVQEENRDVAVKKFSRGSSGTDDFLKELTIINRLRHKHLVPLVGWCHEKGILLLVYEYMPNGSLDQHLYGGGGGGGDGRPLLCWERRYNIVAGVASALHYLHDEYEQRVIHRDLKSSNVMLDVGFGARLGDFGLARALETDKTSYAELELGGIPGTLGYIAPECFHTGKATRTSDVFGFGAVVLEVVCGRRPRGDNAQLLSDWVWKLHGDGRILNAVDPRISPEFDAEDAERLLLLGLACSHPIAAERPKADAIVQILSRSVPPPTLPAIKPSFVWPSDPVDDDDDDEDEEARRLSRAPISMSITSSEYASSSGYATSQYLSRGGFSQV